MSVTLDTERRERLRAGLQALFRDDFDKELSEFQADLVLDHVLRTVGPVVYNQAVQDVRAHLQGKLDDLDGEVHIVPEI